MLLTIALVLAATIALAALELWLFWRLGERDDRRRLGRADAEERPTATRLPAGRRRTTGSSARLRGRSGRATVASEALAGYRRHSPHR